MATVNLIHRCVRIPRVNYIVPIHPDAFLSDHARPRFDYRVRRQIFGLKADVGAAVAYVDDQTVVYPAGHTVVVYNADEKRQKFVAGTEGTAGITALALAPSRRFLAVAERGNRGLISVFDLKTLKKRKVLAGLGSTGAPSADPSASPAGPLSGRAAPACVWLEFSADGQLLLAQGGAPDWVLTCWNWAKGKAVASIRAPVALPSAPTAGPGSLSTSMSTHHFSASAAAPVVSGCSFSNVDPGLVCVVGANLVRFFRLLESAFRPMPSPRLEYHNVLAHAWLKQRDDCLVAGTSAGDLLLFRGGELSARLSASPGAGRAVYSLVATSKGVVCGLDDSSVRLYGVQPPPSVVRSGDGRGSPAARRRDGPAGPPAADPRGCRALGRHVPRGQPQRGRHRGRHVR